MPGRVIILGAGASKQDTLDLNPAMPLATEFFDSRLLREHWYDIERGSTFKDSALATVLLHYFGLEIPDSPPPNHMVGYVNIEEVYSFIESMHGLASIDASNHALLVRAREDLLAYVKHVVQYKPYRLKSMPLHDCLVQLIGPQDTIISFNWDLIVDHALEKTVQGRELLASQERLLNPFANISATIKDYEHTAYEDLHRGLLIKIHGSVNLAVCTNAGCMRRDVPYRYNLDSEGVEYWPCNACGSRLETFIVPPHAHKSYSRSRFLRLQASWAVTKLAMASEIWIIGYSFPEFDQEARALFRSARLDPIHGAGSESWLRKVVVVNPEVEDSRYMHKVNDLFGIDYAEQAYGHPIELKAYKTVRGFIRATSRTSKALAEAESGTAHVR